MASRAMWKGFIRFSLVSVPVKLYTSAATGGSVITLNQLHKGCNTRIQYKKTCPEHGEVQMSDIVSGFQFAEGQYVIVDPSEIEKMRTPNEKANNIEAFLPDDGIDPRYFSGKHYFVSPDGPMGFKPYALLQRAMVEEKRNAFAQVAMSGHMQLVLLRPMGNLLTMSILSYQQEMKDAAEFTAEVPPIDVPTQELKLAKMLTEQLSEDKIDLSKYRDNYVDNLQKLIEAKIAGKDIITPPVEDSRGSVTNLMEALEKSLAEAKGKKPAKPAKQVAPGTAASAAKAARKRKSS
jgi:DNA end-binding protein Ku